MNQHAIIKWIWKRVLSVVVATAVFSLLDWVFGDGINLMYNVVRAIVLLFSIWLFDKLYQLYDRRN